MPHFASEGPLDDVGALPVPHGVADSSGTGLEAAGADFDPSDEGGSGGDNDCHDTHPNADSAGLGRGVAINVPGFG